eukprot:gene18094-biopygen3909
MQIPDICGYAAPQAPYKGTNNDDAAPQAPPREKVKHSAAPQAPLKEEEEMQLQAPQKHNNAEQILAADVPHHNITTPNSCNPVGTTKMQNGAEGAG